MKTLLVLLIIFTNCLFLRCWSFFVWSKWNETDSECRRDCSNPFGYKKAIRYCTQCEYTEGGKPLCRIVSSEKCEGGKASSRSNSVLCYDALTCRGCGSYTGQWSKWKIVGRNCPKSTSYCGMKSVRYRRSCHNTEQTEIVAQICKTTYLYTYKCSSELSDYDYEKIDRCPCSYLRDDKTDIPRGIFSPWTTWQCSKDCKSNSKTLATRKRFCRRISEDFGWCRNFKGEQFESEEIEKRPCLSSLNNEPVCVKSWSQWGSWSECDNSKCRIVYAQRERNCTGYGRKCSHQGGTNKEVKACFDDKGEYIGQTCKNIDGEWGPWSSFSHCDKTCGTGIMVSKRYCNNPKPQGFGDYCYGTNINIKACETNIFCPVHGNWGPWTKWFCSKTCGTHGYGERFRSCDNPKPSFMGQKCLGKDMEKRNFCIQIPCPPERPNYLSARLRESISRYLNVSRKAYNKKKGEDLKLSPPNSLTYAIEREFPKTIYEWQFGNEIFEYNREIPKKNWLYVNSTYESKTLTVTNLSGSDLGVYVVWARFEPMRRTVLDIMSLSIDGWDNDINSEEGKPLSLDCRSGYLTHIFPNAYLVWMLNETLFTNLSGKASLPESFLLEKTNINVHSGLWQCVVFDSTAIRTSRTWITNSFKLTVREEYDLLKLLRMPAFWAVIVGGIITVTFMAFCFGLHKQRVLQKKIERDQRYLLEYFRQREKQPLLQDDYMEEAIIYLAEGGILHSGTYQIVPPHKWILKEVPKDKPNRTITSKTNNLKI